jgi:hypothetical protein
MLFYKTTRAVNKSLSKLFLSVTIAIQCLKTLNVEVLVVYFNVLISFYDFKHTLDLVASVASTSVY